MVNVEDVRLFENVFVEGGMVLIQVLIYVIYIGESDVFFVGVGDGSKIQLLQVDFLLGLWIVCMKFVFGYVVDIYYYMG